MLTNSEQERIEIRQESRDLAAKETGRLGIAIVIVLAVYAAAILAWRLVR